MADSRRMLAGNQGNYRSAALDAAAERQARRDGGTSVALVGSGFISGCKVSVDGGALITPTFTDSAHISFTTIAHAAGGPYAVRVINPDTQYAEDPVAFQFT